MKKYLLIMLALFILSVHTGFLSSATAEQSLQSVPQLMVYSISKETRIRTADSVSTAALGSDEYYSFCFSVKNNSGHDYSFRSAYARIDDGNRVTWAAGTIGGNASAWFHIFYSHMKDMKPGIHKVDFYMDDALLLSTSFTMPRNWSGDMKLSSILGKQNGSADGRAPYMVFYPQFSGSDGRFVEYSIDFEIDLAPNSTYLSLLQWDFDCSNLKKSYKRVYSDYGLIGGYCGLQVWKDGTHAVIMTVWDAVTEDRNGHTAVHKATLTAPSDRTDQRNRDQVEGSFSQILYPFDWETGHPYRLLIQQSTSDTTGNLEVAMWLCDLETTQWTLIADYDTGLPYTCMMNPKGFLEDYGRSEAPRTAELANIRIRPYESRDWTGADKVRITINNSRNAGTKNYTGSYNFGADDNTVWLISSGKQDLCEMPASGTVVSVRGYDEDKPY